MLNSVVLEENSVDIVEKRIAKNAYLQSNVTKLKKKMSYFCQMLSKHSAAPTGLRTSCVLVF